MRRSLPPFDQDSESSGQGSATYNRVAIFNWENDPDVSGNIPRGGNEQGSQSRQTVRLFDDVRSEFFGPLKRKFRRLGYDAKVIPSRMASHGNDVASWDEQLGPVLIWGFMEAGNGTTSEDAEPLVLVAMAGNTVASLVAVFDGMGGAGSNRIPGPNGGFTEAYRASRLARFVMLGEWVGSLPTDLTKQLRPILSVDAVHQALSVKFREFAAQLSLRSESKLRGTLRKTLPTTLAFADVHAHLSSGGVFDITLQVGWAGDSRVWVLTPQLGIQQVTCDDVALDDNLAQLLQDPPLLNVISSGINFELNRHSVNLLSPMLLIVATDGVSGYVRCPGEVELIVLRALRRAVDRKMSVSDSLRQQFASIAGDDVSGAIMAIGFQSLNDIIESFSNRFDLLEARYSTLDSDLESDELERARMEIWAMERSSYQARLPTVLA